MSDGAPRAMKTTFTTEAAEIAEQGPQEFSACSACSAVHFSEQITEKNGLFFGRQHT
jgi:hypothetical protein